MIIAHGIDLVLVSRIAQLRERHAERFMNRVFTPAEQVYCLDCARPEIRLAGRFAIKEAVMKMLGTGWRGGIEFVDIETLPDPLGKPLVQLSGHSAELAARLGIQVLIASISHAGDYAMASVLGVH